MRMRASAVTFFAFAALVACASTKVVNRQSEMQPGERLARPQHIIVYDFAATPEGIPQDSALAGQIAEPTTPPTEKELEAGRQLGEAIAKELVAEIQKMGLPAVRAVDDPTPVPGDLEIRGYFVSIDEGSAMKRIVVGFGSGSASLKTMVEGYLVTAQGLRRLGGGEVETGGAGKTPGVVVPLAITIATANPIGLVVGGAAKAAGEISGSTTIEGSGKRTAKEIADALKPKFQEQGWID
jgi:hypothetical protein